MFAQFIRVVSLFAILGFLALDKAGARGSESCDGRAEVIVHNAYPDATKNDDETFQVGESTISINDREAGIDAPHMMTCRVWPANPQLTLVAVPLIKSANEDGTVGDLELLVVDTGTSAVRKRLLLADRMTDDAIRISAVEFDTARYRLSREQTAFGLRISTNGSSRPNPYDEVSLWLYAIDKGSLHPLLDGMIVSKNTGEWDTNCAGEFQSSESTLSMSSNRTHGYADITVVETGSTKTNFVGKDNSCEDKTVTSKPQTLRLVYDGKEYRIPEDRRAVT
ncbi:hypothetical protein DSM25558_1738 [Agrobacterium sp. DSM 25558]|uniref:hypothetical protein n=1 Tax=Agrobacterium sp. DSM 25558 TaxID=1907665 RepID=UPI0009725C54|nr:hypothetical protein [Agrobacterium sp. DSM 25558]SCX13557.1 hypothetical protein DSM25558_1738 [Agrobacterium sp. DSM 25558]